VAAMAAAAAVAKVGFRRQSISRQLFAVSVQLSALIRYVK